MPSAFMRRSLPTYETGTCAAAASAGYCVQRRVRAEGDAWGTSERRRCPVLDDHGRLREHVVDFAVSDDAIHERSVANVGGVCDEHFAVLAEIGVHREPDQSAIVARGGVRELERSPLQNASILPHTNASAALGDEYAAIPVATRLDGASRPRATVSTANVVPSDAVISSRESLVVAVAFVAGFTMRLRAADRGPSAGTPFTSNVADTWSACAPVDIEGNFALQSNCLGTCTAVAVRVRKSRRQIVDVHGECVPCDVHSVRGLAPREVLRPMNGDRRGGTG